MEFTLELTKIPAQPVPEILTHLDWREFAACLGADPDIFFDAESVDKAKAYCRDCPVMDLCLNFAEQLDRQGILIGPYGVWGGLTATERRDMRRKK